MENFGILVPVQVPWMISPSVPYLRIESPESAPLASVTFIGFFQLEGDPVNRAGPTVISDPGSFVPSDTAKGSQHRLVRVLFGEGAQVRKRPAFSDLEVIPEQSYDWSNVFSGIQDGETPEASVARVGHQWKITGFCPDPGMYEVRESNWLREIGLDPNQWRHYILLGHDEYVEVIAREYEWQPGQVLD
ncbi:MAG: hypothetical protein E6Q88_00940 [Lysobacteraceae bacterium]|nr:MAG: hypothetical protein E6Q88_00940 [Xanthomonadaceae bacterium]